MADRLPSNTVRKLVNHWGTITQNLQLNDIEGFIMSDGTFTKEELAKIKRLPTSRGTEEFLYLLIKKSSTVFNSFLEALRNSSYNDIADIFDESMGLEDNRDARQFTAYAEVEVARRSLAIEDVPQTIAVFIMGNSTEPLVFLSEQHHKIYYLQQENETLRDEIEILMNRFRLVEDGAGKEASAIITTDMAHLAQENEELKEEVRELRKKLETVENTSSRKSKSCSLL